MLQWARTLGKGGADSISELSGGIRLGDYPLDELKRTAPLCVKRLKMLKS